MNLHIINLVFFLKAIVIFQESKYEHIVLERILVAEYGCFLHFEFALHWLG